MKNMESLWPQKIIPVAVIPSADAALPLAETLLDAGLGVIEVMLRTDSAMESIRQISSRFPEMIVGAGTVFNSRQVHELQELDVNYIMTPGINEDVVGAARERDLPILPGVMTPTEIDRARALGLKYLKFFPAEAAGGPRMLQAIGQPYAHTDIKFIPSGGITLQSLPTYLDLKSVAAVGSNWIVETKLIEAKDFAEIKRRIRQTLDSLKQ